MRKLIIVMMCVGLLAIGISGFAKKPSQKQKRCFQQCVEIQKQQIKECIETVELEKNNLSQCIKEATDRKNKCKKDCPER
ncbi:MAG: hypothetical protein R3267_07555 [Paenisporosarcina sp.]|nr:hypothetical protein [Paenisporosarcina sp.]